MGAIAPARPIWCEALTLGRDTHAGGTNNWSDDFNHGQSMAQLSPVYVHGFIGNGDALHFQHNDHWMVDIQSEGRNALIGAWMRPNRSFRPQADGALVIEFEVAGPIAGTREGDTISDSWPELVLSTAPAPPGMQAWGSPFRKNGTYLYEGFPGFWTFGCRMQQSMHPICALYMNDLGTAGTRPSRLWEINQNGNEVGFEFGGDPANKDLADVWKACNSTQDSDVICRNKFRWEIRANEVKLFTNGVLYYHAGLIDSALDNILKAPGGVYVFFGDFAYRMDPGRVLRFHWDRIAINTSAASPPSAGPAPTSSTTSGAATATPTRTPTVGPTATPTPTPTLAPRGDTGGNGGGGGSGGSGGASSSQPSRVASAPAPVASGGGVSSAPAPAFAPLPAAPAAPVAAVVVPVAAPPPAPLVSVPRSASASIPSNGGTVQFQLSGGQQIAVSVDASFVSELMGASGVIEAQYDPEPSLANGAAAGSLGGGNVIPLGVPFNLKLVVRDVASSSSVAMPDIAGSGCVALTLPVLVHPPADEAEFAWLMEVRENDQFLGYVRLTGDFDGASNALNYCLSGQDLRGTLFLPALIVPAALENFDPEARMWSAPTAEADDFGLVGPQFTPLNVVGPQVGGRILVFNTFTEDYGWVDAEGVGPAPAP